MATVICKNCGKEVELPQGRLYADCTCGNTVSLSDRRRSSATPGADRKKAVKPNPVKKAPRAVPGKNSPSKRKVPSKKQAKKPTGFASVLQQRLGRFWLPICVAAVVLVIVAALLIFLVGVPSWRYSKAEKLFSQEQYQQAIELYAKLGDYKDAPEKRREACLQFALSLKDAGKLEDAKELLLEQEDGIALLQKLFNRNSTIACGFYHAAALAKDGTVLCAGNADQGQNNAAQWQGVISLAAGDYHTLGLKKDGTVVAAGLEDERLQVSGWKNISAIAAGGAISVGLKTDGTVVATGDNYYGACDVGQWKDIVAISVGSYHTVGLKADGTVVAIGNNDMGQCDVTQWTDIVAIVAGGAHTLGLKEDGTVVATGDNTYGQCEIAQLTDVVRMCAGDGHSIFQKKDGSLVATGHGLDGQCAVGDYSQVAAFQAGGFFTLLALSDGTAVLMGDNSYNQHEANHWPTLRLP